MIFWPLDLIFLGHKFDFFDPMTHFCGMHRKLKLPKITWKPCTNVFSVILSKFDFSDSWNQGRSKKFKVPQILLKNILVPEFFEMKF